MARELEGWRGPVVSDTKASRTESSRRVVSYFRVAMPRFRVWICSSASAWVELRTGYPSAHVSATTAAATAETAK